ncbi:TPA: hypothetical protein U1X08_000578 [Streptococcus suis]|uniref:Uncharacterized protein n=1 Tax=Streptococcus suis TaxID=1307 RepID=A0A116PGT7_STRSU|nr:hypothetical protein [Streptococcus suis]QBX21217.1 hypothetical protein Javan565_0042 [Streptococcus phage Javan565]AXI65863.1 hypothetical protein DP111_07465 [Streptococcus suis]MBO8111197.1 hypothetical protein [Streptococcus suis]MBS8082888.1 hypothetical protein [Streptococcus suis]MBS8090768.1 hypothetical protein [Streptococcus suis]
MTNEKLGVLLVDVPEPRLWGHSFLTRGTALSFSLGQADDFLTVERYAYKCTQEEAKKYPQFRWVALEDLG